VNPVTVEALRDDWVDRPDLTPKQRAALEALDDAALEGAIEHAFTRYLDMWYTVLDETRGDATRALISHLGIEED
jgi:hypothetical protein